MKSFPRARKSRLLKRRPKKALSGYTLFVKDYLDKGDDDGVGDDDDGSDNDMTSLWHDLSHAVMILLRIIIITATLITYTEKNKEEKGMKAVFSEAAAKWRRLAS